MKSKSNQDIFISKNVFKILLAMKVSILFIVLAAFPAFATSIFSQNVTVSVNMHNATLREVISEIEKQGGVNFFFNDNLAGLNKRVNVSFVDQPIKEVLDVALSQANLTYEEIRENFVVLLERPVEKSQQDPINISGRVTDAQTGESLPGVSIMIKGLGVGTTTNFEGEYFLNDVPADAVIVFSYIGMITREVPVENRNLINVVMEQQVIGIDEIVVIGYGRQSRRYITGSIASVDMSSQENLPNTGLGQALRGRVAGVQFTDQGRPGQAGSILVRGSRSLSAGNAPLIILDNIYFNGSIMDINQNDIESIQVLKDASAAAVYGSRAANGVIIITTKRGETEKPTIRVNSSFGLSDWTQQMKILTPERYLEYNRDAHDQFGIAFDPNNINTFLTITEAENYRNGLFSNPYDMVSQNGNMFLTDISLSGSSGPTNYYFSAALTDEKGIVLNDNFQRVALRTNLENQVTDWLTIGTNSMFSTSDRSGVPADTRDLARLSPLGTWYTEDGIPTQYIVPEDPGISFNKLYNVHYRDATHVRRNLLGSFYSIVEVPWIERLSLRTNFSHNIRWIQDYQIQKQDPQLLPSNTTEAYKRNWQANDWVLENILNYFFELGQNHFFDITLMYGADQKNIESTRAEAYQLSSDIFSWNNLNIGETLINTSYAEKVSGISSMARLNYRLFEKYLFTFTVRRDGSSVFAPENKFGTFPSAAISWIASEENFIQGINNLNFLKITASHGSVGNQALSPYQSLSLASTTRYVFGDGSHSYLGIYPSRMANEGLKWETTVTSNLAIEFEMFRRRIGGTIEIYNMDTRDLLVQRALPIMTGYSSVWTNLGKVNNRGIEISLNTQNIVRERFGWSSNFMFSNNKNRIVSLYGIDSTGDGREDDDIGNRWFIGQPMHVYYDYVFDGIYQEGDEMPAGFLPGFARFKDLNGDGIIDAENDRQIVGQGNEPKFRWGLNNTFNLGNFELSVFINGMHGWIATFNELDHFHASASPLRPAGRLDAGWWTPENRSDTRPSLQYNRSTLGHSWYVSRNFVRIQDATLSYRLPQDAIKNLSNMTVYVSAKNLYTFTNWLGHNPESISVDRYPFYRTFSVGCNFSF